MKKDKKEKGIFPTLYSGYMWKEFSNKVNDFMGKADLNDRGLKGFGTPFKIEFYKDYPLTEKEVKQMVEKLTKSNDVELIVLNGKMIYDRKKYQLLSDGQKFLTKDEMINIVSMVCV